MSTALIPRFTGSVRASGEVSSSLSQEATLFDLEALRKKRTRKKELLQQRQRTVAHFIEDISSKCNKQETQKVSY